MKDPDKIIARWIKWLEDADNFQNISQEIWKPQHLVGYIRKKYKDAFGKEYSPDMRALPAKSLEVVVIKKLCFQLGCHELSYIKLFIDWVWEKKIMPKKLKLRSFGFFLTPGFYNQYMDEKINIKIDRSTPIPLEYQEVAKLLNVEVSSYGDLAFMHQALKQNPDGRENMQSLLKSLNVLGLDNKILENL